MRISLAVAALMLALAGCGEPVIGGHEEYSWTERTRGPGEARALARAVREGNRGERIAAARTMARDVFPDSRDLATAALAEAVGDEDPWVRRWTVAALGSRDRVAEIGVPALVAALVEELTELEKPDAVKVIDSVNRRAFATHGGRSVSWAMVRMLAIAKPKVIPGLLGQSRGLVRHLVGEPSSRRALTECTVSVRASLEALGGTDERLTTVLASWREAGCPTGSPFRRTDAHRALLTLRVPKVYGMRIDGRFGVGFGKDVEGRETGHYRGFRGAQITWSLPWKSRMDGWVGVRGRRKSDARAEAGAGGNEHRLVLPPLDRRAARQEAIHEPAPAAGVKVVVASGHVVTPPRWRLRLRSARG